MADGPEFAALPLDAKRGLRCCLRCNLVKTFEQFVDDGCDNCPVLGMKDDQERVADCTSRYVRVRPPPPGEGTSAASCWPSKIPTRRGGLASVGFLGGASSGSVPTRG